MNSILKIITYAILRLLNTACWCISFLVATFAFAIGVFSASKIDLIGILACIILFAIAYGFKWLAEFLEPDFLYYGEGY